MNHLICQIAQENYGTFANQAEDVGRCLQSPDLPDPSQDPHRPPRVCGHHDTDFYGATEGRNHAWALVALQLEPLGRRSGNTNTYDVVSKIQDWAAQQSGFKSLVVQAQRKSI